ncbi:hypothetical protein PGB90_009711 [Kerria lacca]
MQCMKYRYKENNFQHFILDVEQKKCKLNRQIQIWKHKSKIKRLNYSLNKLKTALEEIKNGANISMISEELKDSLVIFEDKSRVFNVDETAFFLHSKREPVIATKGSKNIYDISSHSNKENMTVLVTGNANGDLTPTMLLYCNGSCCPC